MPVGEVDTNVTRGLRLASFVPICYTSMVNMNYEAGDPRAPRGHALLYFRIARTGSLVASYLVALPIPLDLSRYMPPMFSGLMAEQKGMAQGAMPVPPLPEAVESHAFLRRLAALRNDDLLFGGDLASDSPDQLMMSAAEAAQRYGAAYDSYVAATPAVNRAEYDSTYPPSPYDDLSEGDRVRELVKLIGNIQYAREGGDERHIVEAEREIRRLGSRLPEKYRANDLVAAVKNAESTSNELVRLLIERCFRLLNEEYEALPAIEERIRALRP
mgnify:CR=1 FL=1